MTLESSKGNEDLKKWFYRVEEEWKVIKKKDHTKGYDLRVVKWGILTRAVCSASHHIATSSEIRIPFPSKSRRAAFT